MVAKGAAVLLLEAVGGQGVVRLPAHRPVHTLRIRAGGEELTLCPEPLGEVTIVRVQKSDVHARGHADAQVA
jgi:hypothetical protein